MKTGVSITNNIAMPEGSFSATKAKIAKGNAKPKNALTPCALRYGQLTGNFSRFITATNAKITDVPSAYQNTYATNGTEVFPAHLFTENNKLKFIPAAMIRMNFRKVGCLCNVLNFIKLNFQK